MRERRVRRRGRRRDGRGRRCVVGGENDVDLIVSECGGDKRVCGGVVVCGCDFLMWVFVKRVGVDEGRFVEGREIVGMGVDV